MLTCGHVISKDSLIRLCKGKPISVTAANNTISATVNNVPVQIGDGDGISSTNQSGAGDMMQGIVEDPLAGIPLNAKIKCPYCPTETLASQSLLVHF
jgi:hypothetical protein